jgi:hypothetical protein
MIVSVEIPDTWTANTFAHAINLGIEQCCKDTIWGEVRVPWEAVDVSLTEIKITLKEP